MRWYQVIGIFLAGVFLLGAIFTSLPVSEQEYVIPFNTGDGSQGMMLLTIPTWLKLGDTAEISLRVEYPGTLEENEHGRIDLVSQMEIGFLEVFPNGEGYVSIIPGSPIIFKWQIRPTYISEYSGTVWLFQKFSGLEKQLILGKKIDLPARPFLGLSYLSARIISFVGLSLGAIILILSIPVKKNHTNEKKPKILF